MAHHYAAMEHDIEINLLRIERTSEKYSMIIGEFTELGYLP